MSNKNSEYYFLRGGGEMGELIRAKDWSKTPLGDPADWPQSLRTMIAVMLDNPFGMYIAWGSEYTQLYNDGYRPILGATKHPQALGISTKETFSEIWDNIVGSMFDDVMKGKAVGFPDLMLPLNRNGFIEECYFDFSYSPIREDDGEVGGVLVTVIETTEKKKAQAELWDSTDQLKFAMDAAELGTWDYNPASNKFTANDRLKTWFGLSASEEIELHHATDAIAEKDKDRIITAIKKALDYSSGGIYDEEYSIINPINNNTIIVQGKGRAWFNEDRIAYRFTGVLQEVTEKVLSRKSIEESEARFRAIADDAPVFIFLAGENAEVEYLNKTWRDYTGISTNDYKGRAWAEITHPDDVDPATKIYMDGFNKRESCSFENRQKGIDGIYRTILWKATPRFSVNGQFIGMMGVGLDIHERKKSEEKLRESEQHFQAAVKAVQGILWTNNARGEMEGEQVGWALLTGQTYEEYQGYGWTNAVHPDDVQPTIEAWNEAVKERKTFIFEHSLKTKDGRWRDFAIRAIPLLNADGTLLRWVGVHTDITDNKQAAKALKANEEKLNIVIEASELGTYELNLKTKEPTYSKRYLEILGGYKEDTKLTHAQLLQHLHPDDFAIREKAFKKAIDTGHLHYEARLIWKDKSVHWMEGKGKVFYDDQHNPEKLIGTIRDITEEKNHEQELKKSEEQFSTLADNMENLAWLADGEGWIYWYNRRWLEYTGLTLEEMQGWGWQKVHHPDHVERILEITKKIWHINESFELTFPLRRHDGEYRWFLTRGYPVTNEEGKIIRWIGTNTDINEQKKAEEQFRALADQAPMWVWLTDKEVKIQYTNPEVLKFLGIAHYTEFTGDMWEQKVHPEDIGMVYKSFGEAASLQQSFSFEFRVLNGSTQQYEWFYIKAVPRWEEGEVTGFIGTGINIHEQKVVLSQLEYRKALLEAHSESSLDGILLVDTKGRIISYNHRFVEIWNMPPEIANGQDDKEALKFAVTQLVNPEQFMERVRWMYENPKEISIDELEFKDGKIIERHGYHVAGADGSYYGCSWMFRDITQQRKSERAVKESEEKFRLLADSMPQHIWTSDPEGNLNYYNQSVFDYSGLTLEQINKDGWIQIVHPDDREENIKQWINSVVTGKDFLFEHRFRRHDGEYRWQLSRAIPQKDKTGKIQMWVGTSTDIQDQKTFAKELEEKVIARTAELTKNNIELENKTIQLEEAQQLAHIGSWEWDVVANKIKWSDELFRIFGLVPQEFKADYENYLRYIHPDDREYVNSIIQQALKDHLPYSLFHKVACADGKIRILSATGKVITDGVGNVTRMSGTAQDVTEQKNYEEELKISEERFYKIFDSNPVPMSLSEIGNSKIKYANNRFYKAFGYSKEEVIGHSSEELRLLDPEENKRVVKLIFGYLLENRPLAEVQALSKEEKEALLLKLKQSEKMKDFEILYTRKNGEKFPALVSYEVIRIGVDSYTVTSYQDITERKKAEALLRSQNYQLEKMNKELESFAYISSHDLQEPLRKIQTFATLITQREEHNLTEYGKNMFNRMQNSANRMQALIQDLLAYSRTSITEHKFETIHLTKIIDEVKEDLKEELKEKNAILEAHHLCEATIIPFQFRQLMVNLISNSLKFTKAGISPHIRIKGEIVSGSRLENQKLSPNDSYCHITVSDNGIGFEQHYSEKIFDVFQRLHSKEDYAGTGIGLSIVKKIVENHHGIITAKGELNKGATFDIYIPVTH